jgi:hypothetical protein
LEHLIHTNHCKLTYPVNVYKSQSSQQNPHVMVASSRLPNQLYQHLCLIHTNLRVSVSSVNYTPTKYFNDRIPCTAEEIRLPRTHNGDRTRVLSTEVYRFKVPAVENSILGFPTSFSSSYSTSSSSSSPSQALQSVVDFGFQ